MRGLSPFTDWLGATQASLFIKTVTWIIPVTQSIHILCIGIVIASMAMLDMRLAGFIGREQSVQEMAKRFLPWVWRSIVVLLCTGLILVLGEPARELLNSTFWLKMGLLIVAIGVTLPLHYILEDTNFRSLPQGKRVIVRACAVASLLCFIGIIICGRWIAYTQ